MTDDQRGSKCDGGPCERRSRAGEAPAGKFIDSHGPYTLPWSTGRDPYTLAVRTHRYAHALPPALLAPLARRIYKCAPLLPRHQRATLLHRGAPHRHRRRRCVWLFLPLVCRRVLRYVPRTPAGHYKALEWSEKDQAYVENPELGILVEVDVRPSLSVLVRATLTVPRARSQELETNHNVVKTRGPPDSRFTFTSHDAGDHAICLSASYPSGGSWFGSTHVRLYLDIVVGATKADAEHDRSHVSELSAKLRDLNLKLEDIRREQQYQREREANFRDLSESTNSRAVWYSIAQIIVLVCTCAWQLRHLRVRDVCPPRGWYALFIRLCHSDSSRTGKCTEVWGRGHCALICRVGDGARHVLRHAYTMSQRGGCWL